MVETVNDESPLGPMEIFLLAAVSRLGLSTFYLLKQEADLEPGSIRGAIGQLENLRMLHRAEGEKRGRRVMKLTDRGKDFLTARWRDCLDPHREVETLIRSATVALAMGDISAASGTLLGAASERVRQRVPVEANEISLRDGLMQFHRRARLAYEFRRSEMEASFLQEAGTRIG